MQRFDDIFHHFQEELGLTGDYDPYKLNFDCNRAVIDMFENKCGRLSDYGLIYIKYFAQACETRSEEEIISIMKFIDC